MFETNCTNKNGPGSTSFAPETLCPDRLLVFQERKIKVTCSNSCVHHSQHGKDGAFEQHLTVNCLTKES